MRHRTSSVPRSRQIGHLTHTKAVSQLLSDVDVVGLNATYLPFHGTPDGITGTTGPAGIPATRPASPRNHATRPPAAHPPRVAMIVCAKRAICPFSAHDNDGMPPYAAAAPSVPCGARWHGSGGIRRAWQPWAVAGERVRRRPGGAGDRSALPRLPSIDTMYGLGPSRVSQLTVSLDDPDGLIRPWKLPDTFADDHHAQMSFRRHDDSEQCWCCPGLRGPGYEQEHGP